MLHGTCELPTALQSPSDQGAVDSFVDLAANIIVRYEGPIEKMAVGYAVALGPKSKVDGVIPFAEIHNKNPSRISATRTVTLRDECLSRRETYVRVQCSEIRAALARETQAWWNWTS